MRKAVAHVAEGDLGPQLSALVVLGERDRRQGLAVEAGAQFIVMPGLSPRVIERCRELDVLVIPGVATATEVISALDHGLELLKLFPAEVAGGISLLRALQGPFPGVRWIPTGGVREANARTSANWNRASVAAVGGSWMVAPELIAARDFATVTRLAREAVHLGAGEAP